MTDVNIEVEQPTTDDVPSVVVVDTGGDDGATSVDVELVTRLTRVEDALVVLSSRIDEINYKASDAQITADVAVEVAGEAANIASNVAEEVATSTATSTTETESTNDEEQQEDEPPKSKRKRRVRWFD